MRNYLRRLVQRRAPRLAQELERLIYLRNAPRLVIRDDAASTLPERFRMFGAIPGMLPLDQCIRLYYLAYGNAGMGGDIVEIGSWQGRSTCFLAQACKDTGVGVVHAIDHFRGNPGKEQSYVVESPDLSDLETKCRANIKRAGLSDRVRLHAADAESVVEVVRQSATSVRLLFIDGEHTPDAVRRDIELYAPLLSPGGSIVFDDYAPKFPSYARAIQEQVLGSGAFESAISYERTLAARKR